MNDRRRSLPPVNALLSEAERTGLSGRTPHAVLVRAIRETLDAARKYAGGEPAEGWLGAVERRVTEGYRRSLTPVINATGVVLHTNLGRAPLADAARQALADAAGYVALEYELDEGRRGSRQDHTRRLLRELTGAEDAFVATNAAAALFLALSALAADGETIVSRSELVEIGGGFRIPEILAKSGTRLVEVGTTNRVRAADYQNALSPRTRCVLKVHRSNFRITGFTSEVGVDELVSLCRPQGTPVIHDIGSGLLIDLASHGLTGEPLVRGSVASGAVVVFSGDKLLGGPQAGIIVGPGALLSRIASDPLARALRPDKSTVAALEVTLALYRDPGVAITEIPVLRMLTASPADLARRARRLARKIGGATVTAGESEVGGGAFPEAHLATTLVAVAATSCEAMLEALRRHAPPIIARITEGKVVFDVRTLSDDDFGPVAAAVQAARGG
ncbi:MAG: L-seryl-tRNA(Sec) selenium transferase [Gemmatimonadetes bacterium]|nr:L-seryl-tRNA(Sec) selenium transferase [Gemmatimonadota bacterium]